MPFGVSGVSPPPELQFISAETTTLRRSPDSTSKSPLPFQLGWKYRSSKPQESPPEKGLPEGVQTSVSQSSVAIIDVPAMMDTDHSTVEPS